jgi:hypothetical protein
VADRKSDGQPPKGIQVVPNPIADALQEHFQDGKDYARVLLEEMERGRKELAEAVKRRAREE